MFRHIALFQLKDEVDGRTKAQSRDQMIRNVQRLRESIPFIRKIEIAEHFQDDLIRLPGADLGIYVELDTQEDYDSYMNHPVHVEVAQFASSSAEKVMGITFEKSLI